MLITYTFFSNLIKNQTYTHNFQILGKKDLILSGKIKYTK